MPLDAPNDMDQPREIVSAMPSTLIPPTATLDKSILTGTEEDSLIAHKQ